MDTWEKPVNEADLEGALEILYRMRARVESSVATSARMQSRRDTMIEFLDITIGETKAMMRGEPSMLSYEKIMRAIKQHEWN